VIVIQRDDLGFVSTGTEFLKSQRNDVMKANAMLSIVLIAGIAIGIAGTAAIHAQQATTPPAYIIAEVGKDPSKVADPDAARKYAEEAPKSLAAFGAKYLVRGGKVQTLEGEPPNGYIVVIGFDSVEKARGWYNSPAYEAIKPIRQNSTKSRLLLIEGHKPEQ
jgi:uncharacterized protein (DUF1330 family)